MGFFFDDKGFARDPDGQLVKSIDDAMWSDTMGVTGDGRITLRAAESLSRNLSPTEAYEQSIYVNKAVGVIGNQLSQANVREFDAKTGDEITDSEALRLLKKPAAKTSGRRLIKEIASWLNIYGEYAIKIIQERGSVTPTGLYILCPPHLQVHQPTTKPRTLGDVVKWRYIWADGYQDYIRADHLIFDRLFNPHDPVRGLPPTVTGSLEIGGGVAVSRYNKQFFDNNAEPSHIVSLGEGVGRQQREDFEKRYLAEFSARRNNAFKAMVVSGKDVDIKQIATAAKDGAFGDLKKSLRDEVFMLYGVPPAEAGIFEDTKQDTINDQRKIFVDATLAPQATMISEALQYQLVDPFFRFTPTYSRKKAKLTKGMDRQFEEARSTREDSKTILLIDLDTLPIQSAIKAATIDTAAKFKETLQLSARKTAEYFDIDVNEGEDDHDLRKEIWVPNNVACASNPKLSLAMQPKPADPKSTTADKGKKKKADAKRADAKRPAGNTKRTKACEKAFRDLRRLTLAKLDDGELYTLAEADECCPGFEREVRVMRNRLAKAVEAVPEGKFHDAARAVFNAIDYAALTQQ